MKLLVVASYVLPITSHVRNSAKPTGLGRKVGINSSNSLAVRRFDHEKSSFGVPPD